MEDIKPRLIEPGMKYFINETLKQCHNVREKYNYYFYNSALLVFFALILASVLYYKYKGKLTPQEKYVKNQKDYQYVLSQIKKVKIDKQRANNGLLTNLPMWY